MNKLVKLFRALRPVPKAKKLLPETRVSLFYKYFYENKLGALAMKRVTLKF